ncbi:MAG: DUF2189 domain-containing protein [Gammaproteobacteria bacterium]|nr:DUF2189 domain-containing protein [Gammaproteobacteria bacterium]
MDDTVNELPFLAPCRTLNKRAPFRWINEGMADFRAAPSQSLVYGLTMATICILLGVMSNRWGGFIVPLAIMGGIVFLAPVLCLGLYAISAQLERNQEAALGRTFREAAKRRLGTELVFALILLVIFLIWARAFSMVQVFMPMDANPVWTDTAQYHTVMLLVGGVFATITFSFSAFALPMIMHRDVDAITAAVTSINAVLRNKLVMALWAMIILLGIIVGIATFFVGAVVIWPILGLATWHAYLDTIDASEFPRHAEGITAVARPNDSTRAD